MTITSANRTKRGKIAVYVDGEFLFSADESAWSASGLAAGGEADEEALSELLRATRAAEAKRRALNMLSSRSYTARQLTDRLAQKSGREAAHAAVGRMAELGYIDDAGYAARYARILFEDRRYALRRVRHELAQRGVAQEDIDEAVAFIDEAGETERAAALIRDRFGALADETARRRAAALLQRYGYRAAAVSAALRAACSPNETETEDYEAWD